MAFFKEIGGNIYFLEEYAPDKIPILLGGQAGGYLNIDFTYDYPLDGSRPKPILFLLPVGHEGAATEIHLSP
jgi:hypothetical protein